MMRRAKERRLVSTAGGEGVTLRAFSPFYNYAV